MYKVVLMSVAIASIPIAAGQGQQLTTNPQALAAALRAVRGDLPERGKVVLLTKDTSATIAEQTLAASLASGVSPISKLRVCVWENSRWACRLRRAVGAFGVDRVEADDDRSMRVIVTTILPMNVEGSPPSLYYRTHAVKLVRESSGAWKVVSVTMMSES